MNPEEVKKDGRAFGTNQISVISEYINPDFKLIILSINRITRTGLLVVAKLLSCDEKQPSFIFRWDNRADALDIDITKVDSPERRLFLDERPGYKGHHSVKASGSDRSFHCDIAIGDTVYFKGLIGLTLSRELELLDSITV